jgi:hypothetical protein
MPSQFFTRQQNRKPEERLLISLLDLAVCDFFSNEKRMKLASKGTYSIKLGAALFFFADRQEPFSFTWICDVLGLDAEVIRERMIKTCVSKN